MAQVWLIRNDVFDDELERGGFISVGWSHVPDLSRLDLSREGLAGYLRLKDPDASPQRLGAQAGILRRFRNAARAGLRNISALSIVRRRPDCFVDLIGDLPNR